MERTREQFIEKARAVHGDKYDYSKFVYVNRHIKVTIVCFIHGEFLQYAADHLNGHGCRLCRSMNMRAMFSHTLEKFIEKCRAVHGDKYDYSRFVYVNSQIKGTIVCSLHGEFLQRPCSHLNGNHCPQCAKEIRRIKRLHTLETFIEKARDVHGDKYDYNQFVYINSVTKGIIVCSTHGKFLQTPGAHLFGHGCAQCRAVSVTHTLNRFIEIARAVHGDKYDYSKFAYLSRAEGIIICPMHGEFLQGSDSHLRGHGCQRCAYDLHTRRMIDRYNPKWQLFIMKAMEDLGPVDDIITYVKNMRD